MNNNVDFTTHIGGFICGLLAGLFFHLKRQEEVEKEELSKIKKGFKYGSLVLIAVLIIVFIAVMFSLEDENDHYLALNDTIASKCKEKDD